MHSYSPISKATQTILRNLSTSSPATTRVIPFTNSVKANNTHTNFLYFIHEPYTKPINCTTYPSTRLILTDPSHPLHIRTTRRFAAFDPNVLHWNVIVPLDVSKKAVVRNWVRRRIGEVFKKIIREQGEGEKLQGAISIRIKANMGASAIEATGQEVELEVRRVVSTVLAQGRSDWKKRGGRSGEKSGHVRSKGRETSEWLLEKNEEI